MEDKNSVLKSSLKRFLTNAWDLFMLNLVWLVCSLPVLTMGPATCALFSVLLKIARDEPVAPIAEFLRSFKANFKQAFVLGLIAIVTAFVAFTDYRFALVQEGSSKTVFLITTGILCALLLIVVSYSFALQARYDNSVLTHLKNSFALALIAPGKTVSMWLIYAFPLVAVLAFPDIAITYLGWLYFMYGVSLPFYWATRVLVTVFEKIDGRNNNET